MGDVMVIKKIDSVEELQDVYRLRYKVYCLERQYEKSEDHPSGLEMDEFDPYSVHFICYEESVPVGTVRLILPNPVGFPIESHCNISVREKCGVAGKAAEISRLAVSCELSRRFSIPKSHVTFGLIKELSHTAKQMRIDFLFAAMGNGLNRLLDSYGISFSKAGGPVDYHGMRTPYFAYFGELEEKLQCKRRDIFEIFSPAPMPSRAIRKPSFAFIES